MPTTPSFDSKRLTATLKRVTDKQDAPMLQYRYFTADEICYSYDDGYADLHTQIKADANTSFHAFSLTKTFTAVAILQLAEKGLLHIDDRVNQYLPTIPVWPDITIRQLLSHTAGIGNPIPLQWIHGIEEHKHFDFRSFQAKVLQKRILRKIQPGRKMTYSNLGYILAGLIIETVAGVSYEQYITENIIHSLPVSEEQLGFQIQHPLLHATGYHNRYRFSWWLLGWFLNKKKYTGKPIGKWAPFTPYYVNGPAYGGLIGTANAFVAFGQALLKQESPLLSSASRKILFEEQLLKSGKQTGMSLSWFMGNCCGQPYHAHPGGGGGYYCELRLYADSGSFMVRNSSGFSNEKWLDGVDKVLL